MTLKEIYTKTIADEELKKSFIEAAQDKEKLTAWLREQGCGASVKELEDFFKGNAGELSDDDLENVAGGAGSLSGDKPAEPPAPVA